MKILSRWRGNNNVKAGNGFVILFLHEFFSFSLSYSSKIPCRFHSCVIYIPHSLRRCWKASPRKFNWNAFLYCILNEIWHRGCDWSEYLGNEGRFINSRMCLRGALRRLISSPFTDKNMRNYEVFPAKIHFSSLPLFKFIFQNINFLCLPPLLHGMEDGRCQVSIMYGVEGGDQRSIKFNLIHLT